MSEFISQNCPICQNTLSTFLNLGHDLYINSSSTQNNISKFEPFIVKEKSKPIDLDLSNPSLNTKLPWNFFQICNSEGIIPEHGYSFHINIYKACYCKFSANTNTTISSEVTCFSDFSQDLECVYCLGQYYSTNKTKCYYYSATTEQKQDPKYEPPIFQAEFDLFPVLFNKEAIINKISSITILS